MWAQELPLSESTIPILFFGTPFPETTKSAWRVCYANHLLKHPPAPIGDTHIRRTASFRPFLTLPHEVPWNLTVGFLTRSPFLGREHGLARLYEWITYTMGIHTHDFTRGCRRPLLSSLPLELNAPRIPLLVSTNNTVTHNHNSRLSSASVFPPETFTIT